MPLAQKKLQSFIVAQVAVLAVAGFRESVTFVLANLPGAAIDDI